MLPPLRGSVSFASFRSAGFRSAATCCRRFATVKNVRNDRAFIPVHFNRGADHVVCVIPEAWVNNGHMGTVGMSSKTSKSKKARSTSARWSLTVVAVAAKT